MSKATARRDREFDVFVVGGRERGVGKAGLAHQIDKRPRRSARMSPMLAQVPHHARQPAMQERPAAGREVDHHEPARRHQHAPHLPQAGQLDVVREVVEEQRAGHAVEGRILVGEGLGDAQAQVDVEAAPAYFLRRDADHFRRGVDAAHVAVLTDDGLEGNGERAGPAAHVEDAHARRQASLLDHRPSHGVAPAQRHERSEPVVAARPAADRVSARLGRRLRSVVSHVWSLGGQLRRATRRRSTSVAPAQWPGEVRESYPRRADSGGPNWGGL